MQVFLERHRPEVVIPCRSLGRAHLQHVRGQIVARKAYGVGQARSIRPLDRLVQRQSRSRAEAAHDVLVGVALDFEDGVCGPRCQPCRASSDHRCRAIHGNCARLVGHDHDERGFGFKPRPARGVEHLRDGVVDEIKVHLVGPVRVGIVAELLREVNQRCKGYRHCRPPLRRQPALRRPRERQARHCQRECQASRPGRA